MHSSQKKKLIILAIAAFAITLACLFIIKPEEKPTENVTISASTAKYQVENCHGELISDTGASQGRAIAYVDSPESGTDAKIIEVPEGKNILAVNCNVTNLSSAPYDYLETARATLMVDTTPVEVKIYAENQAHLDSNGYPTRSTYGALIYRGESTRLWFISFVDNTVAESSLSLTLHYTITTTEHTFDIRDNLTIY